MNPATLAMRLSLDMTDGSSVISTITGPMCSGKTETLVHLAKLLGTDRVLALRHALDASRTPTWESRTRESFPATVYDEDILGASLYDRRVILIDEAQFIQDSEYLVTFLHHRRNDRLPTVVSGLNMDYQGIEFESMARALALSDQVFTLTARCQNCQRPAKFTHRTSRDQSRIAVGFAQYEPRCLDCWLSARRDKERPYRVDSPDDAVGR